MKLPAFLILLLFLACTSDQTPSSPEATDRPIPVSNPTPPPRSTGNTIATRFSPPAGFQRTELLSTSFGQYLRDLPLKPEGSLVRYYDGGEKPNYNVYAAVVDLPIGDKDLHQCADAVMRLRAEYLWKNERYDEIHFNFTNGFRVDYAEWMRGRRMVVKGNKTHWNDRTAPSNTYADFWDYLELIFMYAGTASLEKELKPVPISSATIGDVLIQGGYPGHAVIIVDEAVNADTGERRYLLAQSYMPAQELQVLQHPDAGSGPWYRLDQERIATPEWTFGKEALRRFQEE